MGGSNEPPLEVNNEGLKTQTVDFQLVANTGGMENKLNLSSKKTLIVLAAVVRKVDNTIHRINHYPVDSVVCFVNTYPLDSDLSAG